MRVLPPLQSVIKLQAALRPVPPPGKSNSPTAQNIFVRDFLLSHAPANMRMRTHHDLRFPSSNLLISYLLPDSQLQLCVFHSIAMRVVP